MLPLAPAVGQISTVAGVSCAEPAIVAATRLWVFNNTCACSYNGIQMGNVDTYSFNLVIPGSAVKKCFRGLRDADRKRLLNSYFNNNAVLK